MCVCSRCFPLDLFVLACVLNVRLKGWGLCAFCWCDARELKMQFLGCHWPVVCNWLMLICNYILMHQNVLWKFMQCNSMLSSSARSHLVGVCTERASHAYIVTIHKIYTSRIFNELMTVFDTVALRHVFVCGSARTIFIEIESFDRYSKWHLKLEFQFKYPFASYWWAQNKSTNRYHFKGHIIYSFKWRFSFFSFLLSFRWRFKPIYVEHQPLSVLLLIQFYQVVIKTVCCDNMFK